MKLLARASALVTMLLGGCIALVPGEPDGTCTFSGQSDTPCGQCLAEHCQAPVNACCGDSSCRASLDRLDTCGGGSGCYDLERDPMAKGIARCLEASCSDACTAQLHAHVVPSATNCKTQSTNCTCTVPGPPGSAVSTPNAVACSESTYPHGLCCTRSGWPGVLSECSCFAPVCSTYANACVCEINTTNDPQFAVDLCIKATCCQKQDGSCWCPDDPNDCYDGVPVAQCTREQVDCGSGLGQRGVASCSK